MTSHSSPRAGGLVRPILLDLLDRRADARAVDADQVLAIATSMVDVGQINPIRVRPLEGDRFEIVAGVHRVEACRSLGLVEVDALIVDSGELFAELAMIDENLCRAELGPADRARQTARRKAIYQELHPETANGTNQHDRVRQSGEASPRFTADTAQATGASERSVQRDAARGERIRDEALDAVAGTDLDTGVFLDELKDLDPDEQLGHVRQRLNGERAIAARRQEPADSLDYFPTPPWATRVLLEIVLPQLGEPSLDQMLVWDPACGEGHITGVVEEYGAVAFGSDIFDYSVDGRAAPGWAWARDFLDPHLEGGAADWIITNPPFGKLALPFAIKALRLARRGVALFVRQQWLEGVERFQTLFATQPPKVIGQFVERVNLCKDRWDPDGDTLTSYVWLVWKKAHTQLDWPATPPEFVWIPPGQRVALTRPDDVERFTAHPVRVPASLQKMQIAPAETILPTSGERSADASQAAVAGETGEAEADAAFPVTGRAAYQRLLDEAAALRGQHTRETAEPILRAGYAAEPPVPVVLLAQDLGHKLSTVKSWAFRSGLTDMNRNAINATALAAQINARREAADA